MAETIHNPDQYMSDLRQILARGRKRLGLLLGAGAPASIHVNDDGKVTPNGVPLIPLTAELSEKVSSALPEDQRKIFQLLETEVGPDPNIEKILSRSRTLGEALGLGIVHGLDGQGYKQLAETISEEIGKLVSVKLPKEPTAYSELASWIGGTARTHPFEIFTPNYDLLLEEAFEASRIPFFDGFCGSVEPFFDPASIANDDLPARWARIWKLHGSLGWDL